MSIQLRLFIAVVGVLLLLNICEAAKGKPSSSLSPVASITPSSSPPPEDPCASISNRFNGFQVCGEPLRDWTDIQKRFPMLMNELGSASGTLTMISLPDSTGAIETLAIVNSQINQTYCPNVGGFYHHATVSVGGAIIQTVESIFFPLPPRGFDVNEPPRFCEVRKGDVQTYEAPLERLSISHGSDTHTQIGRDKDGNLVDAVFNYYPDHQHILAVSFSVAIGEKWPGSLIICNYAHYN